MNFLVRLNFSCIVFMSSDSEYYVFTSESEICVSEESLFAQILSVVFYATNLIITQTASFQIYVTLMLKVFPSTLPVCLRRFVMLISMLFWYPRLSSNRTFFPLLTSCLAFFSSLTIKKGGEEAWLFTSAVTFPIKLFTFYYKHLLPPTMTL